MSISDLFFSYSGRINRAKYWAGTLGLIVVAMAAAFAIALTFGEPNAADVASGVEDPRLKMELPGLVGMGLLYVAMLYSAFAITVKRCHDRGKSGWWSLIALIPIVGGIWALIDLGIMEGDEGTNQYGPNPLAGRT